MTTYEIVASDAARLDRAIISIRRAHETLGQIVADYDQAAGTDPPRAEAAE